MIYNDLTPMENQFENIAKDLFLEWKIAVSVDFPELIIDLKDKNELIMDIKRIVDDAITEISEKQEKLKSMFAKISYFRGYVMEHLNTCWHFNYIFKQTNEFRILSLLRTIDDYFSEETFTANRIRDLYNKNILDETNFINFDPAISVTNEELMLEMEYPEIKSSRASKENPVIIGIKNVIAKMIHEINQFEPKMYMPKNIYEFFLSHDIEALLDLNLAE